MSRRIMLVPVGNGVGLTSVSIGVVHAMQQQSLDVGFYKPVAQQKNDHSNERSSKFISLGTDILPAESFSLEHVEQMVSSGKESVLLEDIIERFEQASGHRSIAVVEGLVPTRNQPYAGRINRNIASALGAEIILVATPGLDTNEQLEDKLEIAAENYGGIHNDRVIGCIFNKVAAPLDDAGHIKADADLAETYDRELENKELTRLSNLPLFNTKGFDLLGSVTWDPDLLAPRVKDISSHLDAKIINKGDMEHRRLRSIHFCSRTVRNMLDHFKPGALLVTPGDRNDVIISASLAAMNGTKIGALLLTGGIEPDPNIIELCQQAFETGMPILLTEADTWHTSLLLHGYNLEVPTDDEQRIEKVKNHTALSISKDWVARLAQSACHVKKLSPPAFRYQLTEIARRSCKKIVLPEGNEPRTIKAASVCGERKIARTVLLGDPEEINRIAEQQGVILNDYVEIIDPAQVKDSYVPALVNKRGHKGVNETVAKEQLRDNVVLGTMMLSENEVDGLVSGAVHTTANTMRPPLQIIKTAPGNSLVSSVFFMLLPDQVLVYGDCAINPDPTAEQLADIAIQSAESAIAFGIDPKVAMISYSTGTSGQGADVDKVRKATELAKAKRPDLLIDGPLQYDAAIMESVAKNKAPESPVAGKATVFIFPDLNTGNTTYKAVQRSADLVSLGPMIQGMGKPVNDLSRGALVDDIVYTIALTAIQATQK